ncbi:unnamed protein product [Angiostrongylus costaricensis]|uniref:Ubiquitin-like domain-containing protein n=1 Tax=Angiostrongylus costaricensis TaxID=334426 RepID=A0A0R3PTK8_ANGCS|nr:unnamed protein product [Angiostrongylus costaricensis]
MTDSTTELKTAYFKLCRESKQRFTIDYKEKDELYQALQKKIGELGIPPGSDMWAVTGCNSIQINSADALLSIVNDCPTVRIIVRTENGYSPSSSDSVDRARGPLRRKHRTRNRSRTRSHSRGWSRSHSRGRSRSHSRGRSYLNSRDHRRKCHHSHSRNRHLYSKDLQSKRHEHHSYSPVFCNEETLDIGPYNGQSPFSSFPRSCFLPGDPHFEHLPICGMGHYHGGHQRCGICGEPLGY